MITMSKVLAKWSYFAHNGNILNMVPTLCCNISGQPSHKLYGLRMDNKPPYFFTKATWWHEVKLSWGQKFKQSK